jgi:putative membrane-bound dehydrogenase-like protein
MALRSLTPLLVLLLAVCACTGQPGGLADKPAIKKGPPRVIAITPRGVLPTGADGRPLNLDFETGDLRDWVAQGDAFTGQPIKGDTVVRRRKDMHSGHQGEFWIGGYERKADQPQGTLTSAPFKVSHPWAAFLVGGGPHPTTCVELARKDTGKVFHRSSGAEREDMHRVVVDLKDHQGKEIFIRLVDRHSGHWGHLNFDDFRFYDRKPNFPNLAPKRIIDLFPHAGLSPQKAAEVMTVPKGFKVTAIAGEPDVRQPIAMTIDDRGRLWVAECFAYPQKQPKEKAHDRILIFEDADGDGTFETRKVFYEGLNLVSGLEVGFGGVWVGQAPELLFIPDRDGDDKPDGPPKVILDGWGLHDTHEMLNSFIWGPDGWLYGCHGVFTHSLVGKPGTPKEKRVPINAGIWRYHPLKEKFEVFAWGTSNPWGIDFNDHGDAFLTCCVIPHLFHVIQGARYQRQAGQHFQPYTYADIQTIARHRHWVGNQWNNVDRARSDSSGGGHAHAGAMVYLGGAWPEKYRGQLFMNNIHGARLNVDQLTPKGSGYSGDGEPDFLKANDLWSQMLYLRYGPDGQVYVIDWYDRNQCHNRDPKIHDRSNGRIFRISYQGSKPVKVDLRARTDDELVDLQLNSNDWYVRTARRLLMERAVARKLNPKARERLVRMAFEHADVTRRLRGLWALHVTGGLSEDQVKTGLAHTCPHVRSWTIQLACEDGKPSPATLKRLEVMAREDSSPVVRLHLASAVGRFPLEERWNLLSGLLGHAGDASDHNLPLMYWYAAEPLAGVDASRALNLVARGKVPSLLSFMIRRVGSSGAGDALALLVRELDRVKDAEGQLAFLGGIEQSLVGRRQVPMPKGWADVYRRLGSSDNREVALRARQLAVIFGDQEALALFRRAVSNQRLPLAERKDALAALLNVGDDRLAPVLLSLLDEPALREDALRGLAGYDDAKTPAAILGGYRSLNPGEKRTALATLASRAPYARALLAAVGAKKVAATDLTADLIRQMRNLKDADVDKQIGAVWGTVRETAADKAKLIARFKKLIQSRPATRDDLPLGRALFAKTCQQCHTLFDVGGKVGPELTGSNRADLDYLLSNVLDPSAVLAKEYTASVVETTRGRVLTGIVREEGTNALTVLTATESVIVPRKEVASIRPSDQSMMPEDLLKPLSDDQVRALVGYLASPRQVALLATPDNVGTFFNGKDLTGWTGNPKLWKVEDGEILGISPGLKRNEFLVSQLVVGDFRLTCEVKLTPNKENSGIQFRSEPLPGGGVKGYQADIGAGWWGKLYEEHGRELLWKESGEAHVRPDDWNRYEVVAVGSKIRTFINGKRCVDLDDPDGARRGILAFQIHAGGPMKVRFRNLKLELNPRP